MCRKRFFCFFMACQIRLYSEWKKKSEREKYKRMGVVHVTFAKII